MKTARQSIHFIIALIAFAAMVFLFVPGPFGQEVAPSPTGTSREEAKQRQAKLPFAKGTIESIDLLRHQLKLKTGESLRTFTYTSTTYVFRGKDKITPDGLKVGETIALRFYTDADGRVLVRRIKAYGIPQPLRSEPPAAAEPAK